VDNLGDDNIFLK